MKITQDLFIKDLLARTSDSGERAKMLLCYRFSFVYLMLTLMAFPICIIFKRYDILVLTGILVILNFCALICLRRCQNYKNTVLFIAAYSLISAVGNSLLASLSLSIIIFIWPVIVTIFISFILGSRATLVYLILISCSIIGISVVRIINLVPVNPVDEMRVIYSTGLIIILTSIFLYYFLKIYDQSRNDAITAKLESLESKDNILHVVAHDLRNALSGSAGILPLFKESLTENNIEECKEYLEIISQSTASSLSIVNEILESATLLTDTRHFKFSKTDVLNILREVIDLYHPAARKKQISIAFQHSLVECFLEIDITSIKRIFGNLLSNAIKFTRTGGMIEISVKPTGDKVMIAFKDNGIGIPESMKSKIFNKYTTAGRRGTNGEYSTGLGMYIVKNLLDLHKAVISVESKESAGTTFFIEFPIASN